VTVRSACGEQADELRQHHATPHLKPPRREQVVRAERVLAGLSVGSTPGTVANVQSAGQTLSRLFSNAGARQVRLLLGWRVGAADVTDWPG
jgi:hypothetical protein